MINYRDYEKQVYNWLMQKHDATKDFTFSVRQNASKGTELDYFIGTEKSNYFATTFWTLPVSYPGSSTDSINLRFGTNGDLFTYRFEFTQTNTPQDNQNQSVLNIVRNSEKLIKNNLGLKKEGANKKKMFSYITKQHSESYTDLPTMLLDIEKDLELIIPIVNKAIEEEKKNNSELTAHSIELGEFNAMQDKLNKRFVKYKDQVLGSTKESPKYWLYTPGRNAEHWDAFYEEGIMAIGWDKLGDLLQYESKDDVFDALKENYGGEGDKRNDVTANDEFCNEIQIGDVVIVKRGSAELLGYGEVTSDYYFDEKREDYKHCRTIDWKLKGNWQTHFSLVLKTLTDFTQYKSKSSEYAFYYENLMGIMKGDIDILDVNNSVAINQILYGPPGTGKTYALKQDYFPLYTTKETSITSEKHFESVVKECSWWEVIAVALLQLGESKVNDIFNHKWVKKKAELSNSKTIKPTLWGQLQSHTVESCDNVRVKSKQQPLIFNKTKNSTWEIIEEEVENQIPELYDLVKKVEDFVPDANKVIERFTFVTFHQSFSYEDFIEGIKPIMPENEAVAEDLGYKIEDGVFKEICKEASGDPNNRYAIFIDEINRGNVSAIFGELITLIEVDKRTGAKNELRIKLPYSKKEFSVPSNLDIYGTMNTADRSVEALDTALRRRFEFKEMMPDYTVIANAEVEGIRLSNVLKTINERIELLIDREHAIGHSYFVGVETAKQLAKAFTNKIIPLLQEYFYGDYGKIGLVLGNGFVERKTNKDLKFSSFKYEGKDEFITPTFILKPIKATNVIEAMNQLFENKES
ncbi:AAA family ATPase [Winogradskyella wichelsiae]|uniref:AAA family ATPase n=1 Tax=Winogradskyella wichelsiae TaxID=2697007 RepID=UPI001C53DA3B|nr:AAA family ATPase [Winogradskyella wichelsiae]